MTSLFIKAKARELHYNFIRSKQFSQNLEPVCVMCQYKITKVLYGHKKHTWILKASLDRYIAMKFLTSKIIYQVKKVSRLLLGH